MADELKKARITEVKKLLDAFCERHLNNEFCGYAHTLCDRIGRKRKIVITQGRMEIWAASIIHVIARVNFLFDKSKQFALTADIICDFFHTKKTTISSKAKQIEDALNIRIAEPGLCSQELTDKFTFYKTPDGFIVPKSMASLLIPDVRISNAKAAGKPAKKSKPSKKQQKIEDDDKQLKLFE